MTRANVEQTTPGDSADKLTTAEGGTGLVNEQGSNSRISPAVIRRVMNRVAEGESVRSACRGENVSRRSFYRCVEDDVELRERMAASVAMRAHALFDEMLDIADGRSTATSVAARIVKETTDVPAEKVEAVARGIAREQIQRDRLAWDARRWGASRLLPSVYGTQTAATSQKDRTIHVVFDPLPSHAVLTNANEVIPDVEFEVLPSTLGDEV